MPVVGVYETMPTPGYDYQSWMLAETNAIQAAVDERHVDATIYDATTVRQGRPSDDGSAVDGVSVVLVGRRVLDDVSFTVAPVSSPA